MSHKTLGSLLVGILLPICIAQNSHASIVITSVHRGISVNGFVSSNSGIGDFTTAHLSDFGFGTVYAEFESTVSETQFRIDGWGYEHADWDGPLNDVETSLFFEVAFTLESPYTFNLTGTLIGMTESEHYILDLSLIGPGVDLTYDVWNSYKFLDEAGALAPGSYRFSVSAYPSVLGGLDGGWAEVYLSNVVLGLSPAANSSGSNVPEPTTAGIWTIFCLLGTSMSGRCLRGRN
jgi:hypothetical protein